MTTTPSPISLKALPLEDAANRRATPPATLRNYYQTLLWTMAAVLLCCLCYAIEKYVAIPQGWLPPKVEYRMFKNPAEVPMRLFGLPHFIVGTLFLLTSRRMRGFKSVGQLLGLAALGTLFCWLFHRYGHDGGDLERINPLALLLFYFYFLIHGFRDEAFFYKAYGDMPKDAGPTHARIMTVLQLLLLGLLLSLALPAYVLYGEFRPEFRHPALDAMFPADWNYGLRFLSTFGPMTLIAAFALWRIARVFPDGLRGLWRMHRPILCVFMISTGIILLALVSGPWSFNVVVLMHFVGWYLFGRYSLAQRPPAEPPRVGTWRWMRSTRLGFTWLHLGLAVIVVGLVMLSAYAFGKSGPLEMIVGAKVFYYWTILHVTLSFFPR